MIPQEKTTHPTVEENVDIHHLRGRKGRRRLVIYCRYSSEMQREESCTIQEQVVREHLEKMGIDTSDALVLKDQAISGERGDRDNFLIVKEMLYAGQISVLAVYDQSRLARSLNVKDLIKDATFHDTRFIAVRDSTDTARNDDWEVPVGFREIHNAMVLKEMSRRVRDGIAARARSPRGSAGDLPFGYQSDYEDPDWLQQLRAGKLPGKIVSVEPQAAGVVRQIFEWYVDGWRINEITRELNRRKTPKRHKGHAPNSPWNHEFIKRVLKNRKYIGIWAWGRNELIRDSQGRKRSRPAQKNKPEVSERPHLRIIEQELWDRAQARHRASPKTLAARNRLTDHNHPRRAFSRHFTTGLVVCGECGSTLNTTLLTHVKTSGRCKKRYYFCQQKVRGLCGNNRHVAVEQVVGALTGWLSEICSQWPAWLAEARAAMVQQLQATTAAIPGELAGLRLRLEALGKQVDNIVQQIGSGLASRALSKRLQELEEEEEKVAGELAARQNLSTPVLLPDQRWVQQQMSQLSALMADPSPALMDALRCIFKDVRLTPWRLPGRKRPLLKIQFKIAIPELLAVGAPATSRERVQQILAGGHETPEGHTKEFEIELVEPSMTHQLGPRIHQLRAAGWKWRRIGDELGLAWNQAWYAYRSWRSQTGVA